MGAPPRRRSCPPPRSAALNAPLAASEHYGPAPLVFGANQDRLRETAPGISEQRILSHSSLRSPISLYQSSKCFWRPLCEIQASINVGTMIPSIFRPIWPAHAFDGSFPPTGSGQTHGANVAKLGRASGRERGGQDL